MASDDQRDKARPHKVDGIEEYDNPLPGWWLGLFFGTILFAIGYLSWAYLFGGMSLNDELAAKLAADAAQKAQQTAAATPAAGGAASPGVDWAQVAKDPAQIKAGQEIFATTCVPCHGPDGGGVIGPNLTDNFALHGCSPEEIHKVIKDGVPDKGMVAWGAVYSEDKLTALTAYVLSLRGTKPATPKEPQGDPCP